MANQLQHENSPYLLQHQDNPVAWYPWGEAAFAKARGEDKPIFLSIGYSTCHWCHVMAHESFEDESVAAVLNRYFVCIKVDKEERPDIDSIYMAVCQAFTGSGGWPTSIFMTPDQKPFFAGTYFPKHSRGRMIGLMELAQTLGQAWQTDRAALVAQAARIVGHLRQRVGSGGMADLQLAESAVELYRMRFDPVHGGFGRTPKFPSVHNLLFLLDYYERFGDEECLEMAERTLTQMYRGGLFDHIGGGFCRYSTDDQFLVPHFEKMLYDNALLILAYCRAWAVTHRTLYRSVAVRTADYVLEEMTDPAGGFYSAQDADSDGEEGKFYLLTPAEVQKVLGPERGTAFNRRFDITEAGNFEGKSIPNLLHSDPTEETPDDCLSALARYRRQRCRLHRDDKVLTAWNGLMIAALCQLYRITGTVRYLDAARQADEFVAAHLYPGQRLHVSWRAGTLGAPGFLDDYAAWAYAQLALYDATWEQRYLERAQALCRRVQADFAAEDGGFYLYGRDSEDLILRPRETYDGAMPSGNGLMAWNLVRLAQLLGTPDVAQAAQAQLDFLAAEAADDPTGYAMFLSALLAHFEPPVKITVVPAGPVVPELRLPPDAVVRVLPEPTAEYPLKNGKTTYYVCRDHSCLPPTNDLARALGKESYKDGL